MQPIKLKINLTAQSVSNVPTENAVQEQQHRRQRVALKPQPIVRQKNGTTIVFDCSALCTDFEAARKHLKRATAAQLLEFEKTNPRFLKKTKRFWKKHCEARLIVPAEDENWRSAYARDQAEKQERLKEFASRVSSTLSGKPEARAPLSAKLGKAKEAKTSPPLKKVIGGKQKGFMMKKLQNKYSRKSTSSSSVIHAR